MVYPVDGHLDHFLFGAIKNILIYESSFSKIRVSPRYVLSLAYLGYYEKITVIWVANRLTFISHSCKGWTVRDQGDNRVSVPWGPCSVMATFPLGPHMAEGAREIFLVPFIRALITEGSRIMTWITCLPILSPWELGFNIWMWGRHKTFRPWYIYLGREWMNYKLCLCSIFFNTVRINFLLSGCDNLNPHQQCVGDSHFVVD